MWGNYEKYTVQMKLENDQYRLWKNGTDEAVCVLETYKEKRSVFFSVKNLLPSKFLQDEWKQEYHLLLIGADDDQLLHQDFGVFVINQKGEGSLFKKFNGPLLESYTHCILTAVSEEGEAGVVYRGETPFYIKERKRIHTEAVCNEVDRLCRSQIQLEPFSSEYDETGAQWYRINETDSLPDWLKNCKEWIGTYRHYLLGKKEKHYYIGIPGRFLQKEQPCRSEQLFLLWQPIRGGESFFDRPEKMTKRQQEEIFGYWIAELDTGIGKIQPL